MTGPGLCNERAPVLRYAFLAAIPAATATWFVDHRVGALLGIAAILLSFIGIVFDLGR